MMMRRPGTPIWVLLLISHYVAITAWVHSMRVMPDMPQERRIPYFFGFANTVLVAAAIATGPATTSSGNCRRRWPQGCC